MAVRMMAGFALPALATISAQKATYRMRRCALKLRPKVFAMISHTLASIVLAITRFRSTSRTLLGWLVLLQLPPGRA